MSSPPFSSLSSLFSQRDGLKLRQEILKRIKTQVQLYLGQEPHALRNYALAYKKDIERTKWEISSKEEFHAALLGADVVFGGDFHAFAQAQRVHLRALREVEAGRNVILALECVPSHYQKELDAYMSGKLSEAQFLKKTGWEKNWGFPWTQYRPLLDVVRAQGGRCLALNEIPRRKGVTLRSRDVHAVKILSRALKNKKPDELIYVLYGDLHIARDHIPKALRKSAGPRFRAVSIYLNPEKIYFQLAKRNLEQSVSVIKFSDNEFCLLESPPWVKWQSYLLHLEEAADAALDEEDSHLDYTEHVAALMKIIAADLKINDKGGDVSIYSFNNHDFLDLMAERLNARDLKTVRQFVQNDMVFFHPEARLAFLSRGSVNYAAHLAGHIFGSQMSQRKKFSHEFPEEFSQVIWLETMAFFLSKVVNPHRKSISFSDLKKQLAAFSPKDSGETALRLALDQKMRELLWVYGGSKVPLRYKKKDPLSYYKAARILGGILGERLFRVFKTGRLSRRTLAQWMKQDLEGDGFHDFYVQVLKELDRMDSGDYTYG